MAQIADGEWGMGNGEWGMGDCSSPITPAPSISISTSSLLTYLRYSSNYILIVERPWNIGLNAQVKILVDFLFRSDIIAVSLIAHECGGPIQGMMFFVLAILLSPASPVLA